MQFWAKRLVTARGMAVFWLRLSENWEVQIHQRSARIIILRSYPLSISQFCFVEHKRSRRSESCSAPIGHQLHKMPPTPGRHISGVAFRVTATATGCPCWCLRNTNNVGWRMGCFGRTQSEVCQFEIETQSYFQTYPIRGAPNSNVIWGGDQVLLSPPFFPMGINYYIK